VQSLQAFKEHFYPKAEVIYYPSCGVDISISMRNLSKRNREMRQPVGEGTLVCYRPEGEFFFEQLQLLVRGTVHPRVPARYPVIREIGITHENITRERLWSDFFENLLDQIEAEGGCVWPCHVAFLLAKQETGTRCLDEDRNLFFLRRRKLATVYALWEKWAVSLDYSGTPHQSPESGGIWLFDPA
jgi:hypothetical protein